MKKNSGDDRLKSELGDSPRDSVRRDCEHPGTPHLHGTRRAYVSDRCGCTRCRAANRATDQRRTAAIAHGRWEPYADARRVHDHLVQMRKEGLGIDRIAQLSAVPRSTIQRILSPDAKRPKRIRSDTAKRLMALSSTAEQISPHSHIDSHSTRLRVATLVHAGHSLADIARAIGKTAASLSRSLERRAVTVQTAAAVEALGPGFGAEHPKSSNPPPACGPSQCSVVTSWRQGGALQFHEGRRTATRRALAPRQSPEPPRPFPLGSSTTNERPGCDHQRELPLRLHARRVREERVSESPACQPCFCISSLQDVTMPTKTGRRSKGDRDAFAIRPMRPVGDRIRENAAALGITYNDYVTGILARAVGMPEYAPLEPTAAQLHLDERMTA